MKLKNTITYRPLKVLAILCWAIGFTMSYLAQARIEAQFHPGSIELGFKEAEVLWLPSHYGTLGILFIVVGLIAYLVQHHKDANPG